ncbi:hypothetical protein MA16_Dca029211 [Dendrobium catenatum]|uniref:Uncharacterized protein n=1 Tax=Dendrobium catenatum TaxID=906689 RepID=A0A2I0V8V9_9ASPA|nr:hypothetical protein MA16_Dca029211 [Dendrobium catenatum]
MLRSSRLISALKTTDFWSVSGMISGLNRPCRFWIVLGRSVYGKIPRARGFGKLIIVLYRPAKLSSTIENWSHRPGRCRDRPGRSD